MGGDWGPLNARARGLGAGILSDAALHEVAGAESLGDLAGRLGRVGYPPDGGGLPATAAGLDRVVSRVVGWRLRVLHRWAGPLRRALPVVFEAEDRRSLRTVLRGVAEGAAPERRLRGLVPTPTLPRPDLEHIAATESRRDFVARLLSTEHPLARAWAEIPGGGPGELPSVDLFEAEAALDRAFGKRTAAAARREPGLRRFTAGRVDRANAWTLLSGGPAEATDPDTVFVEGGRRLTRERFGSILEIADRAERRRRVGEALGGRTGALVGDISVAAGELPGRLLAADVREQRQRAREEPLGPAPFLLAVLRSRSEARHLRRSVWGAAMGAPAAIAAIPA